MTPKNQFFFIKFFDAEFFQNDFGIRMCVIKLPIQPYITRGEKIFRDPRGGPNDPQKSVFLYKNF